MLKLLNKVFLFKSRQSSVTFRYVFNIFQDRKSCRCYHASLGLWNVEATSDSSEGTSGSAEENVEETKRKILETSLAYVNHHGWTKKTLAAGAESLGYPGIAHGLFPAGGAELVHYFYSSRNHLLETYLQENAERKMKVSPLIRDALEIRLRMTLPYKEQWPQAMAIMTLPQHAPTALKNLCSLVNTIWYYAGDRSVDTNWYTKRVLLAAVYKSTELCMLQDKSPDNTDTWNFLDGRMEDVAQFGKCIRQVQETKLISSDILEGGLITVRNILGINWVGRRSYVT